MDMHSASVRRTAHQVRVDGLPQPAIAWPTVILAAVSLALWLGVACVGIMWSLPVWLTFPVSTAAIYMVFTPMHDAAHSSVARRPYRFINELVGWLCSVPFLVVPHSLFRWIHLRHHKYTNDRELDPDYLTPHHGFLAVALFPADIICGGLNWVRTVYKYGVSMDLSTRATASLSICMNIMIVCAITYKGYGGHLLCFWILPALGAVMVLGYVFDHVPHHPRACTAMENIYGCTGTLDGVFSVDSGESWWLLTWLTLGQNYHSIHHVFPTLPWYAYEQVWQGNRKDFLKVGVPLVTLFGGSGAKSK